MLAACYFAAAKASLLLAIPPGYATAVWPPSGIAFAALLILGPRVWPGVWLGAALANFTVSGSAFLASAMATGNTLEGLCAAWLVTRLLGARCEFHKPESVFMFAAIAAASSVLAASVGATALQLAGAAVPGEFFANWYTWWQGDTTGIILVTPFLLAWTRQAGAPRRGARIPEQAIFWGLLAATLVSASGSPSVDETVRALEFLLIPFMAWAGCRYSERVVTLVVLVAGGTTIWGTVHGPQEQETLNETLLVLQAFIGTLALMALALYAVTQQRADTVRERSAQLVRANALLADLDSRLDRRSRKLADARASERRQLALELHEQVELKLVALQPGVEPGSRPLLQHMLEYVRLLIDDLRVSAREELGLLAALRYYAERFERRTGILVEISGSDQHASLDPAVETALFRIAHEAFDNVAQHAGVRHMQVELDVSARSVRLLIRDDGAGFAVEDQAGQPAGRGLALMREKAQAIGASLRVESVPKYGTTIAVEVAAV